MKLQQFNRSCILWIFFIEKFSDPWLNKSTYQRLALTSLVNKCFQVNFPKVICQINLILIFSNKHQFIHLSRSQKSSTSPYLGLWIVLIVSKIRIHFHLWISENPLTLNVLKTRNSVGIFVILSRNLSTRRRGSREHWLS